MANGKEALLREWFRDKNGTLTPDALSYGSNRIVWWQCARGHEWQASVKSRCNGAGCPICTGRKVQTGVNDLGSVYPELAAQWHPTKNGDLSPENVSAGSRHKVWWKCVRGHEWQAGIFSRTAGGGCPVCAGKVIVTGENDLASFYPDIAKQWHPKKNGTLTPQQIAPYSNRRVWWLCPLKHEYKAAVSARTMHGSGCPYCSGHRALPGFNDLATLEPSIAAQWHPVLNGSLTPEMVTPGSRKKVWWECSAGHVWMAIIHSRTGTKRSGCPVCAGRVSSRNAEKYTCILAASECPLEKD